MPTHFSTLRSFFFSSSLTAIAAIISGAAARTRSASPSPQSSATVGVGSSASR